MKYTIPFILFTATLCGLLASCFGNSRAMQNGGEVTGQKGMAFNEPAPFGMIEVKRGYLKTGLEQNDSLWGTVTPSKDISVDGFWMDQTEVTNSMYRQFVEWVRDSIIRERLADPQYGGDETFKIEEDRNGDPVKPYLNWAKPIPWKKPTEEQERAIQSVYYTHPIDGTVMLDAKQLIYRYEIFDYEKAALRKYRLDPKERSLNTDAPADPDEVIMISKDTAYVNDNGEIIRQTIERPLSSLYDFLNTYIVNVYPDTTCWVNDFPNAQQEQYMKLYFSSPNYNDYPVVGVTWEQAEAFCAWRTNYLLRGLGPQARYIQRYRLPTEIEWEYAARGKEGKAMRQNRKTAASSQTSNPTEETTPKTATSSPPEWESTVPTPTDSLTWRATSPSGPARSIRKPASTPWQTSTRNLSIMPPKKTPTSSNAKACAAALGKTRCHSSNRRGEVGNIKTSRAPMSGSDASAPRHPPQVLSLPEKRKNETT